MFDGADDDDDESDVFKQMSHTAAETGSSPTAKHKVLHSDVYVAT